MRNRKFPRRSVLTIVAIALISATNSPVTAQSNQNAAGGLLNLIGQIAQGAAKAKAQKGWAQTSEPIRACVSTTLSSKNISIEQLVAGGIAPTDQRIAPLVASCNQIMAAQLQTNFPCNVTNAKGQQVHSICNQVFAKEADGQISEVSREDFLRAAGNGEKVQIAILETSTANAARLAQEQRIAEAERQAFLASPEGKRQADAAAAAEKKRAIEEAARTRQAELARRAEAAKRAREFPYTAEISCQVASSETYLGACLSYEGADTTIKINNGGRLDSYKYWNLNEMGEQNGNSFLVKMRSKFSIEACNVANYLKLSVKIKNSLGKVIIQRYALEGDCIYLSL